MSVNKQMAIVARCGGTHLSLQTTQESEIGRLWFQPSLGKKFMRSHEKSWAWWVAPVILVMLGSIN
jgi:hypothetical protein